MYANSYADIRYAFGLCERLGLAPSLAIYEPRLPAHRARLVTAQGVCRAARW